MNAQGGCDTWCTASTAVSSASATNLGCYMYATRAVLAPQISVGTCMQLGERDPSAGGGRHGGTAAGLVVQGFGQPAIDRITGLLNCLKETYIYR